jgi:hypothetical protein
MSIFSTIGAWISKAFKSVKHDGAKIAMGITEGLQTALNNGTIATVADIVSGIFPGAAGLSQDIVAELQKLVPKALATELAIEGLPDNPTESDILSFENKILAAFKITDDHSQLWTVLASQIYGIIKKHVGEPKVTFFELAADVQEAWLDYKKDVADVKK